MAHASVQSDLNADDPGAELREYLRERILERVEQAGYTASQAAEQLGLSRAQMSRLKGGVDEFTLDRLVAAAARIELTVHLYSTRPYARD